jgi:hypothetical protein
MVGMNTVDWAWLARGSELYDNIYGVEIGASGPFAFVPTIESMPWPVALLLGSHSKKHIFDDGLAVDRLKYSHAALLFQRRLKWSWVFRNSSNEQYVPPLTKREIPICDEIVDPVVSAFGQAVRSTVLKLVSRANSHIAPNSSMLPR